MTVAIDNERTKLTANALDRASTACLAIGIFVPLSPLLQTQPTIPLRLLAMSLVGWLLSAIVLHFGVRGMLGGLEQ